MPLARILAATALVPLSALPAAADVTARDVWSNLRTAWEAFGGEFSGTATDGSGGRLDIDGMGLSWTLPKDGGTLAIRQSAFGLVENDDGTVSFDIPDEMTLTVSGDTEKSGPFSGTLLMSTEDFSMEASGRPDEVTYTFDSTRMGFRLGEWTSESTDVAELGFEGAVEAMKGTSTVTVTDRVTMTSTSTTGLQTFEVTSADGKGGTTESDGSAASSLAEVVMILPKGGLDVMNMAAAFAKGTSFSVVNKLTDYETTQVIRHDDKLVSNQQSRVGSYDQSLNLAESGLAIEASATDADNRVEMPMALPVPIEVSAEEGSFALALPVSAGDDAQPASLQMDLAGLTLADDLWALFDREAKLPRDPMALTLDLQGRVKNTLDWFDFATVAARMDAKEIPVELKSLDIRQILLRAAGAEATGEGELEFDNTDTTTYGGLPKPEGSVDVTLKGVNTLIDRLIEMKILPESQAMGARMMIGMVAKPAEGEDVLTSHVEFTDNGQILANGMRMR